MIRVMTNYIVHDAQPKLNEDSLMFQGKDNTYYVLFFVIKLIKKDLCGIL